MPNSACQNVFAFRLITHETLTAAGPSVEFNTRFPPLSVARVRVREALVVTKDEEVLANRESASVGFVNLGHSNHYGSNHRRCASWDAK